MKGWIRYLLIGVLGYALLLVVMVPAGFVARFLPPPSKDFGIYDVSGTLWSGHAGLIEVGGYRFESIDFSLSPLALLIGRLGIDWSSEGPSIFGSGELSYGLLSKAVSISDTEARLPVADLAKFFKFPGVKPDGALNIALDEFSMADQGIEDLEGVITWQNALLAADVPIGDLEAVLAMEGENATVKIQDKGGPLSAEGLLSIKPTGEYQYKGTAGAKDAQDTTLVVVTRMLGQPRPDGKVEMQFAGRWPQLGAKPVQ
ncbi:MAG: type II secretion system protein N [Pseudomonadota bacterium]